VKFHDLIILFEITDIFLVADVYVKSSGLRNTQRSRCR